MKQKSTKHKIACRKGVQGIPFKSAEYDPGILENEREREREAQKNISYQRSEFVFCNRNGGPLDYRQVNRKVWHPLLRHLGLQSRRAYHSRHTAATLWLSAGENPEWIARQLGHATTEMLFRVYSRYVPNMTRRDGSAFEDMLTKFNAQELTYE